MGFLDALIHLFNFLLPALAMALLLPTLARLLWWHTLKGLGWVLTRRVAFAGVAVLVAGLVIAGRDGAMGTYAALVISAALVVWWTGFKGRA